MPRPYPCSESYRPHADVDCNWLGVEGCICWGDVNLMTDFFDDCRVWACEVHANYNQPDWPKEEPA